MTKILVKLARDETGATAVEYGLIAMLISVAIIGILGAVGSNLATTFTSVNAGLAAH